MEPTLSGHQRKWQLRSNNPPEFRESGTDVPVGTAASARSTEALRCFIEASACSTLIRQRPPTPSHHKICRATDGQSCSKYGSWAKTPSTRGR
jgi:hypothetical protein